jgi:hypothetical protein
MRVQLTINIDSGNDSFQDGNEVQQLNKILQNIMWSLSSGGGTGSLYDDNGNHVGSSKLELSEDEE